MISISAIIVKRYYIGLVLTYVGLILFEQGLATNEKKVLMSFSSLYRTKKHSWVITNESVERARNLTSLSWPIMGEGESSSAISPPTTQEEVIERLFNIFLIRVVAILSN